MVITFSCSCGETLRVADSFSGRKAFCVKCRKSVPIPGVQAAAEYIDKPEATPAGAAASRAEPVLVNGKEYWKITCVCSKRLLSPRHSQHAEGTCPKCGLRLCLPGFTPVVANKSRQTDTEELVLSPSNPSDTVTLLPAQRRNSAHSENAPLVSAPAPAPAPVVLPDNNFNRDAAATAADRLRPERPKVRDAGSGPDRISAWPLAGTGRRILAGFIDVTFATVIAGAVFVLARQHVLPPQLAGIGMLVLLLLLAGVLNDGLIHLIWGGSLGKKLVVIVVRGVSGTELGVARTLIRAIFKWLLIPGWIVAVIDPSERALHDLLCHTLVLKGRVK